ncbi:cell division protein FtsQ/DivIB [Hydrogenispora ethanolica]|nr:FtsQ-type POTRA domain-containing protein [Hydrogenispora ethanolica]
MSELEAQDQKRESISFERIFGLLFLLLVILILINSDFFSIKKIEIHGNRYVAETEVLLRSGISPRQNIFQANTGRAKANLLNDPRIAGVTIIRRFPDKVILSISERIPRCWANYRNRPIVISESGFVIDSPSAPPDGLPLLSGIHPRTVKFGQRLHDAKLIQGLKILATADSGLRRQIREINLENYHLYLKLPGHATLVEINLGNATRLTKKLFNLKAILGNVATQELIKIDLRIPDVPTILTGNSKAIGP